MSISLRALTVVLAAALLASRPVLVVWVSLAHQDKASTAAQRLRGTQEPGSPALVVVAQAVWAAMEARRLAVPVEPALMPQRSASAALLAVAAAVRATTELLAV
jgi:hypothetical protein